MNISPVSVNFKQKIKFVNIKPNNNDFKTDKKDTGFLQNAVKYVNMPLLERGQLLTSNGQIFNRPATRMCREDVAWDEFGDYLKEKYPKPSEVDFVVHACSTGEEAYTMAILLDKIYDKQDFTIKAFDISQDRIDYNRKLQKNGIYFPSQFNVDYVCESLKTRFEDSFEADKSGDTRIKKGITDKVQFSRSNILYYIDKLDKNKPTVLMARNMWPYVSPREYVEFASKLYKNLHPDSIVVLGEFDYEGEINYPASNSFPLILVNNGFDYVLYSRFQAQDSKSIVFEKRKK